MSLAPEFADQIERDLNPVYNRTLVAVQMDDMYRWTHQPNPNNDALIGPNGWEDLLSYKNVVTPSDLDQQHGQRSINKNINFRENDRNLRRAMNVLERKLPKQHTMSPEAYQRQMMAAARALNGEFGSEATLVNLDPTISKALGEAMQTPAYKEKSRGLNYTTNGVDKPSEFLRKDGISKDNKSHHGLKMYDPPDNSKPSDFASNEKTVQESFKKGKPKFDEVHQKKVQMKQKETQAKQKEWDKKVESIQSRTGRRNDLSFGG